MNVLQRIGDSLDESCKTIEVLRLNDMHLKNFSLYQPSGEVRLAPAYDMLNVAITIANPADDEKLALTLNRRKKKIKDSDFARLSLKHILSDINIQKE